MTGNLSKNFHDVVIGPLSKILAVKLKPFESLCQTTALYGRCGWRLVAHDNGPGFRISTNSDVTLTPHDGRWR